MSNYLCEKRKNIAIIAGGANGIGFSTLRKFADYGYFCLAIDNDKLAINMAKSQLSHSNIQWYCADLLNDKIICTKVFESVKNYKSITLVNLVGGSRCGNKVTSSLSWGDFISTFELNLKPAFLLVKTLFPLFRSCIEGRIVNVGSVTSRMPLKLTSLDYTCAKSALLGFSRHLSMELAENKVLVNTVCPGIVATERIKARWNVRNYIENEAILKDIPLHRIAEPEDIAETIFFLGSEMNRYMTGAIIDVNGGMYRP